MALRVSATPCFVPWGLSEADSAESCFSGQPSNSHLGCIVVVMGSWGQSLQEVLFRKQAELRRSRFGPLEPFHTTPLQLFLQTSGAERQDHTPKQGKVHPTHSLAEGNRLFPRLPWGKDSGCACEVARDFPSWPRRRKWSNFFHKTRGCLSLVISEATVGMTAVLVIKTMPRPH